MKLDLNPLDVLKIRKLDQMPIHFVKTKLNEWHYTEIESWIKYKLKGRYCLTRMPSITSSNSLKVETFIGFEEEKEMTYFMLACPYLRRN